MSKGVISKATDAVGAYVAGLDPDGMTTAQAAAAYRDLTELERLCASGKLLVAARAAQSSVWKDEGHRSAAEWMAATGRVGLGEAISTLETGRRLCGLPATTDAVRHGELSSPQAKEIAAAAAHRPQSETELLDASATCTLAGLKARCRRVLATRSSAAEENERYLAICARRSFRHWSDPDGAVRGEFTLTPDAGARLVAAVSARADERFDEARRRGREEPPAAHRADALVDLVTGAQAAGATRRRRVELSIHADAAALRRGHVALGETCEIRGVGPVPVATVRSLLPEAFVKVVITKAHDVASVCHVGRTIPASLRSALEARDPTCVVPGCDVALGLEIDHFDVAVADGGVTRLDNLARLCHFHHAQKTYRGYALRGGPGHWVFEPPPAFETPTDADADADLDPEDRDAGAPDERELASAAAGPSGRGSLFDSS